MWPFSSCDVDACAAPDPNAAPSLATMLAALPFALLFASSSLLAVRHLFPRLSSAAQDDVRDGEDHVLPPHAPAALRQVHAEHGAKSWGRKGGAWAFGATVGLAATLGALIMAEILEVVDARARNLALRVTVPGLLFMLVVLIPWLECRSLVSSAGWSFQRSARGTVPKFAMGLQTVLFGGWLFAFWWMGNVVPRAEILLRSTTSDPGHGTYTEMLTRACLERIGVVGISLMALLSGFASVSSPWHTFSDSGKRKRPLTEGDVNRKQTGLDATCEMLATKRHRLQYLERKVAADNKGKGSGGGLFGMVMGSIRGQSSEVTEIRALRIEIAGLETMEANLSSNLSLMKSQRAATERASTPIGRLLLIPSYIFSAYCVYRILATSLTTLRRASSPSASFSSSDPINRFLGLLARHWDPKLDQLAWARIISFALSGVILAASANSAVQTFHLFAKWTPGLLRHAQANLALAVGQVAATYVISAGLLLRSQLPGEARTVVGGVLRGLSRRRLWTGGLRAGSLLGAC
ncbi:GPCR-type G 2-like protein [Cladobotryum mycophilum]|uniref:GPCR-type G 2-like protein n=1 Tax=Cladobotryum mycophilum TaxID=491253 RepID=A0ABR0SZF7_9HYPO